ncbi:hypothetical protein AB0G79_05260 [Streptomyces sp. NPDC020807]|uniref:hypothetical protein n=1 Tax=Streptomyces sp. NPDC020807 TaxID=3155119 RepID=UPI00340FA226
MSRRRGTGALVAAALLLGLTGCASAVDPLERLGRKAVEQTRDGDGRRADVEHVRAEGLPRG